MYYERTFNEMVTLDDFSSRGNRNEKYAAYQSLPPCIVPALITRKLSSFKAPDKLPVQKKLSKNEFN